MFVVCQDYASSCGFNFLGNWFVALQCKAIVIALLNVCGDVNLTHEIHEYYTPPPNNDDSTVLQQLLKCINVNTGFSSDIHVKTTISYSPFHLLLSSKYLQT